MLSKHLKRPVFASSSVNLGNIANMKIYIIIKINLLIRKKPTKTAGLWLIIKECEKSIFSKLLA